MPCPFFHFVLKHSLLPVGLGFASPFAVQKVEYTPQCLFFYLYFCLPITQDLFCQIFKQEFVAESYLTYLCGYKRVVGSLEAGRSTRFPAIIETPRPWGVGGWGMGVTRLTLMANRATTGIELNFFSKTHPLLHYYNSSSCLQTK